MTNVSKFPPIDGVAGELCASIVEVVESYDGRISYAAVLGAIEIAKRIIMDKQMELSSEA